MKRQSRSTVCVQEITFVLPSLIAYYTAEPVVQAVLERGTSVYLACNEAVRSRLSNLGGPAAALPVVSLPALEKRHSRIGKLHRALVFIFAGSGSSEYYRHLRAEGATGVWHKAAWSFARRWPSRAYVDVNRSASRIISLLLSNPFPTRRVVAISPSSSPHLLCGRAQDVITLIESWDHAHKVPAGYVSRMVIAWNEDLADDWRRYQGGAEFIVGYPLKLRHALEFGRGVRKRHGTAPVAMYAAATSATTTHRGWFHDELVLVNDIALATDQAGWRLLIKPKPNGRPGDFDRIAQRFPHVEVGAYGDARTPSEYYLERSYNERRMKELASCDLVINYGTTFALDAAAAGCPILQLDLRHAVRYPEVARWSRGVHIEKYLLDDQDSVLVHHGPSSVVDTLAARLSSLGNGPIRFSAKLRDWLTSMSLEEGVKVISAAVLGR